MVTKYSMFKKELFTSSSTELLVGEFDFVGKVIARHIGLNLSQNHSISLISDQLHAFLKCIPRRRAWMIGYIYFYS